MRHADMSEVIADLCNGDLQTEIAKLVKTPLAIRIGVDDLCRWHIDHIDNELQDALELLHSIGAAL